MEHRIEYASGRCYNIAHGRKDLMNWLKLLKDEEISDVRKMYKNGLTETVMEKYERYIAKKGSAAKQKGKEENVLRKKLAALLLITMVTTNEMTAQAASISVPGDVKRFSVELGEQYGICPELIQAMCFKESSFNPYAENGECIGIMQVNPLWHQDRMKRLGITDLYDTKENMMVGVDYLSELAEKYEDISIVLMKYNGDSKAGDVMSSFADVSEYAEEVLAISAGLERENGK